MARCALRNLKSGTNGGGLPFSRKNEKKGRWVGVKDDTWGNSMGTRFIWPGHLPQFRLQNIRLEFISWMNTFGWEVETVTFSVDESRQTLEWVWIIKVKEDWQNIY